jgi:hypothetical protein
MPLGSRAVFFSDFLGDPVAIERVLGRAADRGVKGAMVQVLDPDEEAFPYDGRTVFESMSGTLRFETLKAKSLRAEYLSRLARGRTACFRPRAGPGWRYHVPPYRPTGRADASVALPRAREGAGMSGRNAHVFRKAFPGFPERFPCGKQPRRNDPGPSGAEGAAMIGPSPSPRLCCCVALLALPILWWLLRAVPPAPIRGGFPV